MNSSSSMQLALLLSNSTSTETGVSVDLPKESFSNALAKNIVAVMVWLALSVINSSMVYTFLQHRYGCLVRQKMLSCYVMFIMIVLQMKKKNGKTKYK